MVLCQTAVVLVQKAMLIPWCISKFMVPVDIQNDMVLHYHGAFPKP